MMEIAKTQRSIDWLGRRGYKICVWAIPNRQSLRKMTALSAAILFAPVAAFGALSFDGVSQYVTFGPATRLSSPAFTVETWFNWTGRGVAANTGNGGVLAIPLVAKMSAEFDGDNRDGNYLLGIRSPDGLLAADMEEGAKGARPGANHPVIGVTPITTNTWHHAAVTYNGTNWMLYLDGNVEAALPVGQPPRSDSIQHAGLASSLNSSGVPLGFFAGMLDEVRIWNYARSSFQITSNKNIQIRSAPGLIGCWSLNETNGLMARDSTGNAPAGVLMNGPSWVNNNRAAEEVITPVKLTVVDPDRTAILRQAESSRLPPIFRFDPAASDQVEKNFLTGFQITRERFLAALEEAFPRHPANPPITSHPEFRNFLARFQSSNDKGLPLSTNVAWRWAEGHRERGTQTNLMLKLRSVMSRYIAPDAISAAAAEGGSHVRIVSVDSGKKAAALDTIESQSIVWPRTNLLNLIGARALMQQRFPTNEQALAAYLGGFLKENCAFDPELTRQVRERHAESIFATDQYEPDQVIIKKGQVIDARIKAALAELKTQVALEEDKARAAAEQAKAENDVREMRQKSEMSEFKSQHFGQQNRWLLGGLIAVAITSSLAVWQVARSRRAHMALLAPIYPADGASASLERPAGMDQADWQQRALSAERRAAQSAEVIRTGLLPHLAFWLKTKLVRGLMSERSHLLRIQQMAERELVELDKRLAQLQAPLEERLRCYEQRIIELEHQLAVQGHQNRELIRAKIESTRRKLEAAQAPGATWM